MSRLRWKHGPMESEPAELKIFRQLSGEEEPTVISEESLYNRHAWSEAMFDIVEDHDPNGYYPWHACSQVRQTVTPGKRPQLVVHPPITDPFGPFKVYTYVGPTYPSGWCDPSVESSTQWVSGPLGRNHGLPADVCAKHSRDALKNVTDQVPAELSVPNLLFEFRDGWKALLPRIRDWRLVIPNIHLWWNFGWLPLVRDVKALLGICQTVQKRLDHLKKVNGKTITVRYTGKWSNPNAGLGPNFQDYDPESPHGDGAAVILFDEAEIRINIRVFYDLDLKGADAWFQAMAAALGLNNPAGIVWEAIPFSFVVDWFTNTGDWIEDNIDVAQPFKGEIAIRGSDHTIIRRIMMEHFCPTSRDSFGVWHGKSLCSSRLVRTYNRCEGMPGGSIDTTGLTAHQQQLAASLIAQGLGSRHFRSRKS